MKKRRSRGRPPLPRGEKKRHFVALKLDDAELKALDKKVRELKSSRSEIIREGMKRMLRE
jgi:hypothetical protein